MKAAAAEEGRSEPAVTFEPAQSPELQPSGLQRGGGGAECLARRCGRGVQSDGTSSVSLSPPSRPLEMSEPKAIDPKLSTTDRVVKGKRSPAAARGAPSAAGARPPLPRPGCPSPARAGDLLGSPASGDPPHLLRRALPPHRPPGPNRGIFFLFHFSFFCGRGAAVGKWLSAWEAVAGVAVAGGGAWRGG